MADFLGLKVEMLEKAREELLEENRKTEYLAEEVVVYMPKRMADKIRWYAKGRSTTTSKVLRSIVYKLLVVERNLRTSSIWLDRDGSEIERDKQVLLTFTIPDAAKYAFNKRAQLRNCYMVDLLRPYLNDLYVDELGFLPLIDKTQFSPDPHGYWQPPPLGAIEVPTPPSVKYVTRRKRP